MEAPLKLLSNRHLLTKSTPTTTNLLKSSAFCPPFTKPHPHHVRNHQIISMVPVSFPRIPASISSPIDFFLSSFSSSLLLNPSIFTSNSIYTFQSNPKDPNFTWNPHPECGFNGGLGGFGGKDRPVMTVVLLGWLGAKQKHLRKYVEWYNSKGVHAITFVIGVRELLWFDMVDRLENRLHFLAEEIASWVSQREKDGRERCLIFHTFSNTGWLVYGYLLGILEGRKGIMAKIKGCIVDSGGGDPLNPKVWAAGFSTAMLKRRSSASTLAVGEIDGLENHASKSKNPDKDPLFIETMVQLMWEKLIFVILKLPHIYPKLKKIISTLSKDQPFCPQLYLYSTADKVVPFQSVESLIEDQKRMGREVFSHNFVSSPHVDHYRTFPDVYLSLLDNFLKECVEMAVTQT